MYEALSSSVWGLKLQVYEALSYWCMRPKLLVYEALIGRLPSLWFAQHAHTLFLIYLLWFQHCSYSNLPTLRLANLIYLLCH